MGRIESDSEPYIVVFGVKKIINGKRTLPLLPLNAQSYLTGAGSGGFAESVIPILLGLVKGGKVRETGEGNKFRESDDPYGDNLRAENEDIGLQSIKR